MSGSSLLIGSAGQSGNDYQHVGSGGAGETWYIANEATTSSLGTGTLAKDLLIATPFVAPARGGTLDRIAWEITTLTTAGFGRIGIYNNASSSALYPTSLIAGTDTGQVALAAALQANTISVALSPGRLYWIAHVSGATPANTYRIMAVTGALPTLGVAGTGGVTAIRGFISVAFTFAALPDPYPAGAAYVTGTAPYCMFMRYSA